jgi:hypothetical protein
LVRITRRSLKRFSLSSTICQHGSTCTGIANVAA